MKRVIITLLALYIVFVACLPCSDGSLCADNSNSTRAVMTDQGDLQKEFDLCSPFCVCSCCSSSINQPKLISFTLYSPGMEDFNSIVPARNVKAISFSIWQPPKLA